MPPILYFAKTLVNIDDMRPNQSAELFRSMDRVLKTRVRYEEHVFRERAGEKPNERLKDRCCYQ